LDDVLPVSFQAPFEVVLRTPPLLLGPERGKSYSEKPAVFGILRVTPRETSSTLAWAGDQPIAVEGTHGKGRVFVFGGTVFGEADSTLKPFWETAVWSNLFQRMVLGE